MATNTQFSIAVHLMLALGFDCGRQKTSSELATSINTSPSFVRRILAKLSKANLVSTTTGKSGSCALGKRAEDISLLEIYKAVDSPQTFAIHDYPVQNSCRVSCNIETTMKKILDEAQNSFESSLEKTSLAQVVADIMK
ncbi:MAG: Rrf2 family transcriptional regulator [Pyrinomonadaceae bacterium]|nr:Rrf2 family transcriptional regulator [Pyrinomonadaceae bacterium]